MSKKDPKNIVNVVGYDNPIGLWDVARAALRHGATVSPQEMARRRRRQRHHTVAVYLIRLFSNTGERLQAFDRETQRGVRGRTA